MQLVGDGGVGGNTDTRDGQVGLCRNAAFPCADDMFQEVNGVKRNGVGWQAGNQGNGALFKRPHVYTTIGPVCKQQVQRPAGGLQVIPGAQLRARALVRLLNDFRQVKVERSAS